jgi:hypothetical protein
VIDWGAKTVRNSRDGLCENSTAKHAGGDFRPDWRGKRCSVNRLGAPNAREGRQLNVEVSPMSELSRDEVVEVLGPLSDVIVAEVIATGISKDQLILAHDRVVRDHKAHNPGPPLDPGRFAQVVDILERAHARGLLGEAGSTLE